MCQTTTYHVRPLRTMNEIEHQLLISVKNGDLQSFELIFKSYYSRLQKYANSIVHDNEIAGDMVKDTFVKWWENRFNYSVNISLSGFLYRSVHNHCINYVTRKPKQQTMSESDLQTHISELAFSTSSDYPIEQLYANEIQEQIEKVVEKLPDQCREIFILSRSQNLTHEEIGQKLNISVNTVKVQIYRALLKLRADLKEFLPLLFYFIFYLYYL